MISRWREIRAALNGEVYVPPSTVLYTVCGTGVPWNVGYPFDLGDQLETEGIVQHQPIGYRATAFPMQPSINEGEAELARQILLRDPVTPWMMAGYSQGAIITSNIYDRVRNGDLQAYRASFLAGVTFGNPRREQGHTLPGGTDPGGHGIVTPNLVGSELFWLDFAAGKHMPGSPGNDLYTTCGAGESADAVADQEAIWKIVDKGTISSTFDLVKRVVEILPSPLKGGIAAAEAALGALGFFVAEGIRPHTSYQFIQPIPNDPRDCWRLALDYLRAIALNQRNNTVTTPEPAPAALALDLGSLKGELKTAVSGLLDGLKFVQKFSHLIPNPYAGQIDSAVKVLTFIDGLL